MLVAASSAVGKFWQVYCSDSRDLKQHDTVMRRQQSLAKWLFNCSHALLINDPILIGIL